MKSYTDIEQSKKLAEILPLESADMVITFDYTNGEYIPNKPSINPYLKCHTMLLRYFDKEETDRRTVPCWSLAALLSILPMWTLDSSEGPDKHFRLHCKGHFSEWYDNLVDVCYETIIRLHEK